MIKCFGCEKDKDRDEFPYFETMPEIKSGFCKECWNFKYGDDKHAVNMDKKEKK